jgi:tRNA threonylcarbamoyladenosine biosynthesis protein TsaE
MDPWIVDLPNPTATAALGRLIGKLLFPGSVAALVGPLGAGKTYLVRAIAEGLHIADSRIVSSPTFVLIHEYLARLPIYHFDAYRLHNEREFAELGVQEYFECNGVCLVEWADKVANLLPVEHLHVHFEVTGESSRRATLSASGPQHVNLLQTLTAEARRERQRLEQDESLPNAEPAEDAVE